MRICLLIGFLLIFNGISFAQTVSVKTESANLLSAPSENLSNPLLRVPEYYPLNVLETKGEFYRAQDYRKRVGWIEKARVNDTKTVVVKVRVANIRKGPGTGTPVLLQAKNGVTFKVLKEQGRWLEVRHESGRSGWIFKSLTWGQ
jgi:SH3-like domain-containing protein